MFKVGVIIFYIDRMMLSVCYVVFFGFMCFGEFIVKNKSDKNVCIFNKDILFVIDNLYYCLIFRKLKIDFC